MMTLKFVIAIHNKLEVLKLCSCGIRDNGLLMSAIAGQQWYENDFRKYIHVAYSINAGHIFNDGNKRTSFIVIKELCKYGYVFNDRMLATEILNLASNTISEAEFFSKICMCVIIINE